MDWSAFAIIVTAGIAAMSGWVGAKFARRKERADAASIITATAVSLLVPLNADIVKLTAAVEVLQQKVLSLEADKLNLWTENTALRSRIGVLEHQIMALGHIPTDHPGGSTVTTSKTEVVTVTEGAAP